MKDGGRWAPRLVHQALEYIGGTARRCIDRHRWPRA